MRHQGGVHVFKHSILAGVLSIGLLGTALAAPNWPLVPYSYYANQEDLPTLLREFAGGFSLALQIGPNVKGVVNGKFNTNSPTEFLNRLGGVYGFNWFVHSGTLFVSRSDDMQTRTIDSQGSSITAIRDALEQLGVLDPRFGWGELADQGIALVSGPPAYVALVEKTVKALPIGPGGQEVAVFKLKHASVNDRTVTYRDSTMVTPGLATVLRNLITGDSSGVGNETLVTMAAPLREKPPLVSVDSEPTRESSGVVSSAGKASPGSSGLRLREATVQADTRLNAIIVQDVPERIPVYRALIEQLDVPSTLIEIEAMIVDVNSELVRTLGVSWGLLSGDVSVGYNNLTAAPSRGLSPADGVLPGLGTLGLSVGDSLVARLRALQTEGQATILSQPSILTTDNMGAVIDLSDTFYVQTSGERVATVTPITAGTSLRVTPRYIGASEGMRVELTVDIEDGRIQDEILEKLPTVRKSTISTLAVVENDQTLLIGGYNSTQDSNKTEKVPFLGDIPFLGALFSHRSKTLQRRERLFLLRPRVVAINGKPVVQPLIPETPVFLDATWNDTHPLMGGRWLERADTGSTRLRRWTATRQPTAKATPIDVADYFSKDSPF
ncbi:EscC/YscC/HrcC family type III secretion system outer membrane ring protein [Bordetella sp. 02P26C-1]|nr:EscC/YscC/HrcC family type III secretion system outer membrane ring protein [Bordetella sp. 02P26C-1]